MPLNLLFKRVNFVTAIKKNVGDHQNDQAKYQPKHEIGPDYQDRQQKQNHSGRNERPDQAIELFINLLE